MAISELERDLKDGIVLIQLLEILSNQALYKNKRPRANANPRVAQVYSPVLSLFQSLTRNSSRMFLSRWLFWRVKGLSLE